ncbi:MAG: energy transducer TonB [Dyadobacter sp.]|uniref:energy transducer TonB n=1 Tax=Dyadobacter sp. TaxID=1914288 RepID=UPI0032644FE5
MNRISGWLCYPILYILILGLSISASAQKSANESGSLPRRLIFTKVEQPPEFVGGTKAIEEYLLDNLTYPEGADNKFRRRTVFTKFIVTETGEIDSAQVVKSHNELVDAVVLRAIKNMPAWIPGKQNGHAVAVWYNMPVRFPEK